MAVSGRSRALAVILIVLTFLGTSGTWHVADDPDCFAGIVVHDHSAHHERFGAPAASTAPEHCAICHWLQSFRVDSIRHVRVPFGSDTYARFTAAQIVSCTATSIVAAAPRAPPIV